MDRVRPPLAPLSDIQTLNRRATPPLLARQGIINAVFIRQLTMPPASSARFSWPFSTDPFLWLEALDDPEALAWVDEQNAAPAPRGAAVSDSTRSHNGSPMRICRANARVIPTRWKEWAYDLWQDDRNPKEQWRRTVGGVARR